MLYWKNIIPGPNPPELIYAIIECSKGTQNKYELLKTTNLLILDRVLHSSVVFPQDYGFIPGTYASDGDPLDIIVLISNPTAPRTIIRAKPIGVLLMEDEKGLDEKILSVAKGDPFYMHYNELDDLPSHFLNEIREVMKKQEESDVEFIRKNNFVFADNDYKLSVLSLDQIKDYLNKAKFFIHELTGVVEKNERINTEFKRRT